MPVLASPRLGSVRGIGRDEEKAMPNLLVRANNAPWNPVG